MKTATITARCRVNGQGKRVYSFTKGATFYTQKDLEYFDRLILIRSKRITPEDELAIKERWKEKDVSFIEREE